MMRLASLASILLVLASSLFLTVVESREVVCYYGTWAVYRLGDGTFSADNIDPFLCTQLVFAFVDIAPDGSVRVMDPNIFEPWVDTMGKFYALKQRNAALKTMVAVGGWKAGTQNFATVAASPQLRTNFARSAVAFLQQHRLNGMDIDWEYPVASDRANFVLLLRELRAAFASNNFLLTVAVGAGEYIANEAYDIPAIASQVDYINLMTYDMQGKISGVTNHNAPVFPASSDTGALARVNVLGSVQHWLSKGAPAAKLTLGIPLYGHTFTLANPAQAGVGAPIKEVGTAGPLTAEAGMLGYNEICANRWPAQIDSVQMAAYASSGGQWVSYDDPTVIRRKCDIIAQYGLAGGMVWSIETDDFKGICGPKNPLLTTLKGCVDGNSSTVAPPVATTTTKPAAATTTKPTAATTTKPTAATTAKPTAAPTTKPAVTTTAKPATPSGQFFCTRDGFFRNPTDCGKFYRCVNGNAYAFDCPSGLYFNEAISNCDWPKNVKC